MSKQWWMSSDVHKKVLRRVFKQMGENEHFDEMTWDKDAEDRLFAEILADNKHITRCQHTLLRVWCRVQLKIAAMPVSREILRYTQESRLLGSALKIMPTKKEDVTIDLTTAIQDAIDG